jgi:predicted dehydrogenase
MTAKWVVVGCGAVLEHLHRPAIDRLRRRGSLEIAAVVDPNPTPRDRAASWFPRALPYSTLPEAMNESISGVLVLSPPASHVDAILEALRYDVDVFCEKPLAIGSRDAQPVVKHAGREHVSVGMIRRQLDTTNILRDRLPSLVDTSDFRIRTSEGGPYAWPVVSERSFRKETGGVGIILESGIHVLDLLVWVFGPARISDARTDETSEMIARNAELRLEFAGGEAFVRLSWTDPLPPGLIVESRLGTIWVPDGIRPMIFQRPNGEDQWRTLRLATSTRRRVFKYPRPRCPTIISAVFLQLSDFLAPSRGHLANAEEATALLEMIDGVA